MDRDSFLDLMREALLSIHDFVALEKSPLGELISHFDPSLRPAVAVKRFLWEGIDRLKPNTPSEDTLDWRYYHILAGRYQEGLSMGELEHRLALGERQLRRMHGRALLALGDLLWEQLYPGEGGPVFVPSSENTSDEDLNFAVNLEPLRLDRVLDETAGLFRPQVQARGGDLVMQIAPGLPAVQADRILLRQVLLHLFNRTLQSLAGDDVYLSAQQSSSVVILEITAMVVAPHMNINEDLNSSRMLAFSLYHLNARLTSMVIEDTERKSPEFHLSVQVCYRLELAMADQLKVLVVDDHEPAIRIIRRYLNPKGIQVIGLSDPTQIMAQARGMRPQAVLLDVMMPAMDGWEILQKLKSDPETRQIPVIICSVWDQPDLAYSLGANGFIKKPIRQAELMAELARSHLLDISDGPPPGES